MSCSGWRRTMGDSTSFWILLVVAFVNDLVNAIDGQCEEISIPMCKEIGYNFTRLPNQFNHETQDEVRFFLSLTDLVNFGAELLYWVRGRKTADNEDTKHQKEILQDLKNPISTKCFGIADLILTAIKLIYKCKTELTVVSFWKLLFEILTLLK